MLEIWQIWQSGGWVMLPLFALAVGLYTQAFHMLFFVRRARLGGKDEPLWWEWVRSPGKAEGAGGERRRARPRPPGSSCRG